MAINDDIINADYDPDDFIITLFLSRFRGARIEDLELDDELYPYICIPIDVNNISISEFGNAYVKFIAKRYYGKTEKAIESTHNLQQIVKKDITGRDEDGFRVGVIGKMRRVEYRAGLRSDDYIKKISKNIKQFRDD